MLNNLDFSLKLTALYMKSSGFLTTNPAIFYIRCCVFVLYFRPPDSVGLFQVYFVFHIP
jgi:hypothetical protein